MSATGSVAFATAHRVVDRVHHYTSYSRAFAHPAVAAGLSEALVAVFSVAYYPNYRAAVRVDYADFSAGHFDCRKLTFNADELCAYTRAAGYLRALAGLHP